MAEAPNQGQREKSKGDSPRGEWKSLHLWQIQGVRDVLVFLAVLGLLWVGQKISIVTVPLLLAVLFAYLFEPVICWVMRRAKWDRQKAVAAVMASALLVVVVPSAVGLTFGVAQSIGFLRSLSGNIETTYAAVQAGRAWDAARAELGEIMPQEADGTEPPDSGATGDEPTGGVRDAGDSAGSDEAAGAGGPADGDADPAGASALDGPGAATTDEQAAAQEKVRRLDGAYQRALDETGEPDRFWRFVAEFIHDQGRDNTLDSVFLTVQQWLRSNAEQVATAGAGALATTLGLLSGAFSLVFMIFITAFFFYFIATGWVGVQKFGAGLIPDRHRDLTLELLHKFDAVINAFIRGRLTIAFLQAIVFTAGYFLIGVPAAFILGPIVAVLSIVPYLALVGVPISIALLATAGYDDFRGEWWWYLGAPTAFYFVGQALDDYVWTPRIQGKGTDMSTPMILFASLAGGVLFGVFGLLIAIPIAACLKILIQEVFWPRFKAWAEGEEKDFLPISRD